jgi:hypothetical protein
MGMYEENSRLYAEFQSKYLSLTRWRVGLMDPGKWEGQKAARISI